MVYTFSLNIGNMTNNPEFLEGLYDYTEGAGDDSWVIVTKYFQNGLIHPTLNPEKARSWEQIEYRGSTSIIFYFTFNGYDELWALDQHDLSTLITYPNDVAKAKTQEYLKDVQKILEICGVTDTTIQGETIMKGSTLLTLMYKSVLETKTIILPVILGSSVFNDEQYNLFYSTYMGYLSGKYRSAIVDLDDLQGNK